MFDYNAAEITQYTLHFVGTKILDEPMVHSTQHSDDPLNPFSLKIKNHLLKPMTRAKGSYKLSTEGLVYEEIFAFHTQEKDFQSLAQGLSTHLYNQSEHPHIKSGECFICHFTDLVLDGELCDAIGIFKLERKEEFLSFDHSNNALKSSYQKGIPFQKIDKGCLVFLTEEETGFRALNIDANNYDTQYWQVDFLGLKADITPATHTQQVVSMVEDFAKEVMAPNFDKKQQTDFIADAVKFMEAKPAFKFEQFVEDVVKEPELKQEFDQFKTDFSERSFIPMPEEFEINEQAFEKEKKKLKSLIKLDTHIQIKIDYDDVQEGSQYLVKGFDQEKGMHFYTIYFNEEMN